jgi:hypothetical protein
MHAAKALIDFKNKLETSEEYENKENAQELLKEYIRKFMKDNDYQKHFEPTVTKIINEYGLVSPSGEPVIENLIKLHLPVQQKDLSETNQSKKLQRNYNKLQALFNSSKSSTNDSTYHKSRANSNEAKRQQLPYAISNTSGNSLSSNVRKKRISSQDKLNNILEKSNLKVTSKPAMKLAAYNRKPLRMKPTQKTGNETNRNRLKMKKITQETLPARGKSEEQKFDEFLMNESEPEESSIGPNQGKLTYTDKV